MSVTVPVFCEYDLFVYLSELEVTFRLFVSDLPPRGTLAYSALITEFSF